MWLGHGEKGRGLSSFAQVDITKHIDWMASTEETYFLTVLEAGV